VFWVFEVAGKISQRFSLSFTHLLILSSPFPQFRCEAKVKSPKGSTYHNLSIVNLLTYSIPGPRKPNPLLPPLGPCQLRACPSPGAATEMYPLPGTSGWLRERKGCEPLLAVLQ
jgi:hypothetical protein